MREHLVMKLGYARPYRLSGWGRRDSAREGKRVPDMHLSLSWREINWLGGYQLITSVTFFKFLCLAYDQKTSKINFNALPLA